MGIYLVTIMPSTGEVVNFTPWLGTEELARSLYGDDDNVVILTEEDYAKKPKCIDSGEWTKLCKCSYCR